MFGSIWNFVKRHKRKFIFFGVVVGGVYYGARYARGKLQEFQELEAAECLEHAKRQHHFDSNQRTCNMTVLAMLPSIKEALMRELDSEAITEQLKNKPANKLEIWDELKVISFTRTLSSVYCVCLVIVFLRVQLNVIGGYMYVDSVNNKDGLTNFRAQASPEVQGEYLALVQHVCEQGLTQLIAACRQHVTHALDGVSLKEQMSLLRVQTLINKVRQGMEVSEHESHMCPLAEFVMIPEAPSQQSPETAEMMSKLWQETHDLVHSNDFGTVLTGCLDSAFSRLVDKLAEYYKPQQSQNGTVLSSTSTNMSMPLAKLVPVVNGLIHTVLQDAPNPFVQELLLKDQVKDFAANIYEAFTTPQESNECGPT